MYVDSTLYDKVKDIRLVFDQVLTKVKLRICPICQNSSLVIGLRRMCCELTKKDQYSYTY